MCKDTVVEDCNLGSASALGVTFYYGPSPYCSWNSRSCFARTRRSIFIHCPLTVEFWMENQLMAGKPMFGSCRLVLSKVLSSTLSFHEHNMLYLSFPLKALWTTKTLAEMTLVILQFSPVHENSFEMGWCTLPGRTENVYSLYKTELSVLGEN